MIDLCSFHLFERYFSSYSRNMVIQGIIMTIKSLMGDSRHFKAPDAVTQFLRTTVNTSFTTYWQVTLFHTNSRGCQFFNVSFRNSLICSQSENVFFLTLSTTVLALEAMPITILAYYYQLHLKESFDKKNRSWVIGCLTTWRNPSIRDRKHFGKFVDEFSPDQQCFKNKLVFTLEIQK